MITGQATPHLQNQADTERTEVGLLIWQNNEQETKNLKLGSRLKSPRLPIWVTHVNDHWGVLFHTNIELLKSHNSQNK